MARSAAAGDASAFATLYQRYEQGAFNLAYRITGSEADAADATQEAFLRTTMRELPKLEDGEPAFALRLFTATRHACHDLLELRRPAPPGEPVAATRQEDDIREANERLPEHQREALALRDLEQLSYGEIAAILETSPESVAKLISRARLNLSDDLHGTSLAAVAAPSAGCERALPLIAAREDGQVGAASEDVPWLDSHLRGCERCGLAVEAMGEAGASYRAWAPIVALPWLLEETMAKGAALAGVDWSEEVAAVIASRTEPRSASRQAGAASRGGERGISRGRRRAIAAAAALAALLLGGGVATALVGGRPSPISPRLVAKAHPADGNRGSGKPGPKQQKHRPRSHKGSPTDTTTPAAATAAATTASPLPTAEGGGGGAAAGTGPAPSGDHHVSSLQPPEATGAPKPKQTPKPASQPAPAPPPAAEAQAPVEPVVEETAPEQPSKGKGKEKEPQLPLGGSKGAH